MIGESFDTEAGTRHETVMFNVECSVVTSILMSFQDDRICTSGPYRRGRRGRYVRVDECSSHQVMSLSES